MTERKYGGVVAQVEPGSIAAEIGIEPGDIVVSVNEKELRDELDYRFYASDEEVLLEIQKKDGSREKFAIEKEADDLLGIVFENPIFDGLKTCTNNCCFCFIRQLPPGMRSGLYVRDDDYRMSFLYGNFITLTNLSEEDWSRLREQRISPLRVSVHTTDPDLRAYLMGNREASGILSQLSRLVSYGIEVHVQIVLLRGVNDGDFLFSTLEDLYRLGDAIASVGVVPAIYTKYRPHPPSPRPDKIWARQVLVQVEEWTRRSARERGKAWVYAADEFYVMAETDIPQYEHYGEFEQYENGIGIIADFRHQVEEMKKSPGWIAGLASSRPRTVLAITGVMAYDELDKAVRDLGLKDHVTVLPVVNEFFGPAVTSAGLLTGRDVLNGVRQWMHRSQRRAHDLDAILIPSVALSGGRFLDDVSLDDITEGTGVPAIQVAPTPRSLIEAVLR